MVCCVQKLSSLENHLYDMFVAMINRSDTRKKMEDKDIHGGKVDFAVLNKSVFMLCTKLTRL